MIRGCDGSAGVQSDHLSNILAKCYARDRKCTFIGSKQETSAPDAFFTQKGPISIQTKIYIHRDIFSSDSSFHPFYWSFFSPSWPTVLVFKYEKDCTIIQLYNLNFVDSVMN